MRQLLIVFSVLLGLNLVSPYVSANIDVYEFSTEEKRQRYLDLTKELRCPKCQNQDIADSNAPIAQDMRREVHRMVEEGQKHQDVVSFMIERFGNFVTYKPHVMPATYLLWFGPIVLVCIGLFVVFSMASKRAKKKGATYPDGLDSSQRKKLDALLSRYDDQQRDDA